MDRLRKQSEFQHMGELNIYGVYVPFLLVQAFIAYLLVIPIMHLAHGWAEQGWIIAPHMVYLCLYLIILWGIHWGCVQYYTL